MYKVYVIPGSHACRSALLMLEHKGLPYRRVDVLTLTHPVVARLHGFDAGGQTRVAGTKRPLPLRLGDRLGTVPALAADGDRISTNHGIARYLDERHPDPPLFPGDPERRAAVEAVERWANDDLQMAARRIVAGEMLRDPGTASRFVGDGRMGHLLYRRRLARRLIIPTLVRRAFAASPEAERQLMAELPATLDRIDAWIAGGILNGPRLNVADFMVAPCLALMLYRSDAMPHFAGRPALDLVDRLLPAPVRAGQGPA